MSTPGFGDALIMRESARCERNVIGPMSTVAIRNGQNPKPPAFICRNKIPAPTAVPKRDIIQLVFMALGWCGWVSVCVMRVGLLEAFFHIELKIKQPCTYQRPQPVREHQPQ